MTAQVKGDDGQQQAPITPPRDDEGPPSLTKLLGSRISIVQGIFLAMVSVILIALWLTTLQLIESSFAAAKINASRATGELAHTYEAQVVRAVREIDQALNVLKRSYEFDTDQEMLALIDDWGLLLTDFLFVSSIADAKGNVTSSTQAIVGTNIADQDYFRAQVESDQLAISHAWLNPASKTWKLTFSRRINTPDGAFAGIAYTSVDASYFVSGYEDAQLGQRGVLGLIGTDGVFRVRRSGEKVVSGEKTDYRQLIPDAEALEEQEVRLFKHSWDQVQRYTLATQLYEFPLAVILGLSEEEQLQASVALRRLYLQRAGATSVLILLIAGLVFYLSRQLQRSRQRILDEQVSHAQRVEYLAYHDGLTGLPNRSYFSQLLNRGIGEAKRYERRFALLFLDLDRFKIINDTLGHDAGDELLIEVAKRLNQALRETDTVARLGGDEFVVLLPEMNEEAQLSAVARKVLSAVGQPFRLAEQDLRITVSIGISVFPGDGEDEQTLLKNADIAMYHAKEGGKNNYAFYSEELNADSLERLALESSLRQALDEDQFVLFYQEKHDIHSNKITGAEALLRWQHPNLGLVLPHQFLPLAEETGLIIPIGKWVLETACHQAVDWIAQGQAPRCVSINLTARQFTDAHLLGDIREALQSTGLDPQLLELEISENLLLSDFDRGLDILHHIKALGVRIAIGNFGTGYTSLSTLETFQFDTLKIDGSVIRDVTREDSDRQLTEAIIAVGRAMAMTIVAEGVETREQAEFLLNSSCDQVQGFYYDKPSPSKRLN